MAWLHNSTVEEVAKQPGLKKKVELATALPVAIERLLPDEFVAVRLFILLAGLTSQPYSVLVATRAYTMCACRRY